MAMLNQEISGQIMEIFSPISKKVTIKVFVSEGCDTCSDTEGYMGELASLNENLDTEVFSLEANKDEFEKYDVKQTPAIVLVDEDGFDYGVKFYGIPAGHEINSIITTLLEFGGVGEEVPSDLEETIRSINKPVNIKVFVTLSCPHCPGAVIKAHKLAMLNKFVTAEMIEANTFQDLSNEYNVSSVPKIVFNGQEEFVGNQPLAKFIDAMKSL